MDAATGQTHDDDSDDEINARITFRWVICGSVVAVFGLINVSFGIFCFIQSIRKR